MVTSPRRQRLRILEGRFVVDFQPTAESAAPADEWLAQVRGPDGYTCVRRDDEAADAWVALWSGDEPHSLDATGMLSAIVSPLADGAVPVPAPSTFQPDLVLVPAERLEQADSLLRDAGHEVRT